MKITATIITLNEERNIARAIESLRCSDEILIVDSGSVDRTVELARKLGARVIEAGWRGYAGQKNWAAGQASHDWILSLDADEALSEPLEAEIWNVKKNGPRYDAYTMPRLARYLGRWILHSGWYPDRKIRLYRRDRASFVGDFVHESVNVRGSVGSLENNLLHYTCDSLSEHVKTVAVHGFHVLGKRIAGVVEEVVLQTANAATHVHALMHEIAHEAGAVAAVQPDFPVGIPTAVQDPAPQVARQARHG